MLAAACVPRAGGARWTAGGRRAPRCTWTASGWVGAGRDRTNRGREGSGRGRGRAGPVGSFPPPRRQNQRLVSATDKPATEITGPTCQCAMREARHRTGSFVRGVGVSRSRGSAGAGPTRRQGVAIDVAEAMRGAPVLSSRFRPSVPLRLANLRPLFG